MTSVDSVMMGGSNMAWNLSFLGSVGLQVERTYDKWSSVWLIKTDLYKRIGMSVFSGWVKLYILGRG